MSLRRALLGVVVLLMALSMIDPPYPREIVLQHIPTVVAIVLLALAHRFVAISDLSFGLIVGYLVLHVIGARWIYSYVPYDRWSESLLGFSINETLGWTRNHYDRLVHLAYGLLFTRPIREYCETSLGVSKRFSAYIAVEFTMATSLVYELIEWGVAVVLAPAAAERYNGQQGDMFDAQKDMALASLGAVISVAIMVLRDGRRARRAPVDGVRRA